MVSFHKGPINDYQRTYCWSAICRQSAPNLVQATIFVSRKGASGLSYYQYDSTTGSINPNGTRPTPVKVTGATVTGSTLTLTLTPGDGAKYIHDGASIVADATGNIYRVLSRMIDTITLDSDWIEATNDFWVVPPPASGGRSPFVGVYQRIIKSKFNLSDLWNLWLKNQGLYNCRASCRYGRYGHCIGCRGLYF